MNTSLLRRAVLALSLSAILTGCAGSARDAQIAAGARIGQAAAGVNLERQPAECGKDWPLLDVPVGQELTTVWRRYEEYVSGPINGRQARCYRFNENQHIGLGGS